jgi:3D (Asp-Asp-Asp) domain-containing protein
MDSSSSSYSSEIVTEESYEDSVSEASYEESYEETSSSSSSSGTYLGTFKLTGYCNCASCCGTAGNATASGVYPTSGHTVAMAGVPFGTQLLINGTVYTVEDLGTPYGHVDIYFDSHSSALAFGLQYAEVYQLN